MKSLVLVTTHVQWRYSQDSVWFLPEILLSTLHLEAKLQISWG